MNKDEKDAALYAAWRIAEEAWEAIATEISPAIALEAFCMVIGQQASIQSKPTLCVLQAQELIKKAATIAKEVKRP